MISSVTREKGIMIEEIGRKRQLSADSLTHMSFRDAYIQRLRTKKTDSLKTVCALWPLESVGGHLAVSSMKTAALDQ